MVALRLATLWLCLIAPAMAAAPRAAGAELQVILDDLELMVEPSSSGYSTGTLRRGDRVVVLSTADGWARIRSPATNFHWANAAEIEEQPDGTCVVARRQTSIRHAADTARLPGPPVRELKRGTVVRLLDHPDLKVESGGKPQTWRAIEATGDDDRFVRTEGLATIDPPRPIERPEQLVSYQPEPQVPNLPAEVNAELASISAMTRSIKSSGIDSWNLDPVRDRHQSLLRQFGANPEVKAAVTPRLDQVERDSALARSAQEFARLLRRSDQRDAEVAKVQRSITLARTRSERNYDAQGLLQPSSRRYQGQKVLALIGPEGKPIGYLSVPPGLPINQFLARKVGVRGIVHFDEELGARLISVRDLELIEKVR